jgi:hypothetical protein
VSRDDCRVGLGPDADEDDDTAFMPPKLDEPCAHVFSDGSVCGGVRVSIIHHQSIRIRLGPGPRDVTHSYEVRNG